MLPVSSENEERTAIRKQDSYKSNLFMKFLLVFNLFCFLFTAERWAQQMLECSRE